ncbi:MAG: penicillin-binding protein 2 [Acidimicrobiia bacterium]
MSPPHAKRAARARDAARKLEEQPAGDTRMRLTILAVVIGALLLTLVVRLWYLQVLDHEDFSARASDNQVRLIRSEAPRGRILDHNGNVLVENRVSFSIAVEKAQIKSHDDMNHIVSRLSVLLDQSEDVIRAKLEKPKGSPVDAIPIAEDVPKQLLLYIEEHQDEFPGVVAVTKPTRVFTQLTACTDAEKKKAMNDQTDLSANREDIRRDPCRSIAPHVLGYVGETTADDLDQHSEYRIGDSIGRGGVEASYESALRGAPGLKKIEVNSQGKQVSVLGEESAQQGNDVVLTLDPDVQAIAEEVLRDGILNARNTYDKEKGHPTPAPGGAVVVLDTHTGGIVAMASYPTFNPQDFIGGIPQDTWTNLNDPSNQYPLNNRAIQGQYPAASTFKVVTAISALQNGFITPETTINAGPFYTAGREGRKFYDWNKTGHGRTDLAKSLVESVDVYYYTIGDEMYQRRSEGGDFLQNTARQLGFGDRTGIDIANEKSGQVPDENWLRRMNNANPEAFPRNNWNPGDNINLSIGQGDLLVTPLQIADVYAAIANGGTAFRPHIAQQIQGVDGTVVRQIPPEPIMTLPIPPEQIQVIQAGLAGVTRDGTAKRAFAGFPFDQVPLSGKTGTAQNGSTKTDTSWFAGYGGPSNEYVVVAVVEEGGAGNQTAAPIVRRIFEGIFGLTPGTIQGGDRTD